MMIFRWRPQIPLTDSNIAARGWLTVFGFGHNRKIQPQLILSLCSYTPERKSQLLRGLISSAIVDMTSVCDYPTASRILRSIQTKEMREVPEVEESCLAPFPVPSTRTRQPLCLFIRDLVIITYNS